MKTFDEAWDIIVKLKVTQEEFQLFTENIKNGKSCIENKSWATMIIENANREMPKLLNCKSEEDFLGHLCAIYHLFFQLGLLTGIEMEKSNASC